MYNQKLFVWSRKCFIADVQFGLTHAFCNHWIERKRNDIEGGHDLEVQARSAHLKTAMQPCVNQGFSVMKSILICRTVRPVNGKDLGKKDTFHKK